MHLAYIDICVVELLYTLLYRLYVIFSHSVMSNSLPPHGLQHARLSSTISQSLLKLMPIELVMPSSHLVLCCLLLLLPSIFPSIKVQ